MLEKNAGLKSRFTSYVKFEDMSPEKCASIVSSVLKGQIPRSIEFERSDEAIESLVWGFADLQHPDRTGWANGRNAHEMAKKILRQRALRAGRNIEPIQLVTADDIGRVISEFLDNRPIVEKSEAEQEISSMATADLFATAFGFKQSQNQHQEQKKEEENGVEEIEDNEEEKTFEFEALLEKEKEELERRLREDKEMDDEHRKAIEDELERIQLLKREAVRMIEAERRQLMALEQKRQRTKMAIGVDGHLSCGICLVTRRIRIMMRRRIACGFVWTTRIVIPGCR